MSKAAYKILFIDGTANVKKIEQVLSGHYHLIHPKNFEEASKVLEKVSLDLVLVSPKAYRALEEKLLYNRMRFNPNQMRILIADSMEACEIYKLEESKKIFHVLETPISAKELVLTLKMAFKAYEIVLERNRLVDNLNQKARILLDQRKQLSDAFAKLKEANLNSIRVLSEAIEAKDPYTRGHCKRVSKLAKAIAEHVGYDKKMMERLELGAFLHDIGKIGIKGGVLNKNGKLTEEEKDHVKTHTVIGENIINGVKWCRQFIPIIRHHHEMVDGKGYPDGLKDSEIPLDARILGIADAYDAMTSIRPYRGALHRDEALRRLKKGSGTQFDPELIKIFIDKKIFMHDLSNLTGFSFNTDTKKSFKNSKD